jgi:hypothetical protein
MLKITTHDNRPGKTLQLEGKLAGPWVGVLERCWRNVADLPGGPRPCVDLTGVTFIDAAGKDLLRALHLAGADLVAVECMTRAIVESITGHPDLAAVS